MAAENDKWISIMIVPEDGAGMRKWRVTTRRYAWFKVAFWFVCLFLMIGFVSMVSLGVMYAKVLKYKHFNDQLIQATHRLGRVAARLDRYEQKENKLRTILGSDIDLPEPVAADLTGLEPNKGESAAVGGMNELNQAVADEEARLRKIPTLWPIDVWQITQRYRNNGNSRTDHLGIDLIASGKMSVLASADGKVIFAGIERDFGKLIVIDHGNGWETKYGHNESILVKYGDYVRKGEQIAVYGGSGGASTGAHLHFGMYYRGQPVDPLLMLEKKPALNLARNGD
ncbi:MAG: M23 family metallopeptidase [Candidatus Latescibacteria bacterium]|nr:M23 family metallopeptidase [Candidatus Latescibacterota bacterium]